MKSVDDVKRNGNVIEDRRKLLEQYLSVRIDNNMLIIGAVNDPNC